ncbi:hypothetical protein PPSIR1_17085 [Plesiocystis pacifica SIR-1]|uniref:Uncharacterized protein n=1 Tax=Plesiocystis pacifica SIR-1 TaxID=391625 RepID=A6GI97_9BACT|nr:hypothetical protein [Plesiocystis pacifica]EDM74399.1 hypothetical protein PPSIR1_17085 [Plesiocystis pacifica SIR-1]
MSDRIRKGSREYRFRKTAGRRKQAKGRRLGSREAAAFVRTLHSRDELSVLRRVAFGGGGLGFGLGSSRHRARQDDVAIRVIDMLETGRLELWVVEARRSAGKRREIEEEFEDAPPIEPPQRHEVVIELVDAEDNPVPFEPYRIKLPDGRVQTRSLDKHGRDRITGIAESGSCMVCFHERDAAVWAPA